jgi:hypothetical protein
MNIDIQIESTKEWVKHFYPVSSNVFEKNKERIRMKKFTLEKIIWNIINLYQLLFNNI